MRKTIFTTLLVLNVILVSANKWINIHSQQAEPASVVLISSDINTSVVSFSLHGFFLNEVKTPRGTAYTVSVGNSTPLLVKGAPDLPKLTTSVIVPDMARMDVEVISSSYTDYPNIDIAPSKGNLYRNIDPATVPYTYGKEYSTDRFFPASLALLRDPYIVRDYRAQTIIVDPFLYNPVTKVLRVYKEIVVKIKMLDNKGSNVLLRNETNRRTDIEFQAIYEKQFLNTANTDYLPVADYGKMLVISYGQFMPAMQPFVDWKNSMGIPTEMVNVATIGTTSAAIKTYIANYYTNNGLTFVLLVGDAAQIPTNTTGSLGGPSDVAYGYVVGDDHYPDLFVGRFSAENITHVQTQVTRTLEYEQNPLTTSDWFSKGIGIASDQGPGDDNEFDYQHIRNIRTDLMGYTYSGVAELYDGSQGGEDQSGNPTTTMVSSFVNAGSGIINYTGHGSDNSWGTTGFSNSNVNALTNQHMWPFIFSVACVNGNFSGGTCFAEAWLRATNGGSPTGAVATLMSTINQSWNPPMDAEDEMDDILVETYPNNIKHTFGGITMNGCMHMNDQYGADGDAMTDTWTIFGDPSVMVRTAMPDSIVVVHAANMFFGSSEFTVNANTEGALVALSINNQLIGTGFISGGATTITISPQANIDTVDIIVTAFNHKPYFGSAFLIPNTGPYLVYSSNMVNDFTGNNNGLLDYGESINISLALNNIGILDATNVNVKITSADLYITITDSTELYSNIPAGDTVSIPDGFSIMALPSIPDNHLINLHYVATGTDTWTGTFAITAHAAKLMFGAFSIADPLGNNNGKADPGETIDLLLSINNQGSSMAQNVVGAVAFNDPFITLFSPANQNYGNIAAGATALQTYSLLVDSLCPEGHVVNYGFHITADLGLSATASLMLVVGQMPVVVIDLDGNHSSGNVLQTSLINNNVNAEHTTTFPADITPYSAIFMALGTYPDNHQLSSAEGQSLANFLNAGGRLYMEGGDAWKLDPVTAVRPMFKINGVMDGLGDLVIQNGVAGTITEGMSMTYNGDNAYIDHIAPLAGAITLFKNSSPLYITTVAYDGGTYKTIGSSFEFSGLTDAISPSTKDAYMLEIINFFGLQSTLLNANFTANPTSICQNYSVNFVDFSTGGATSWLWIFPGGEPDTSYEQNPSVVYPIAGNFDVTLKASNGTDTSTVVKTAFITVLTCTGVGEQRQHTLNLWPNPCNGMIYADLSSFTGKVTLHVTNTMNVEVYRAQDIEATALTTFDLSVLSSGVYFLTVEQDGKRVTSKLVIRK